MIDEFVSHVCYYILILTLFDVPLNKEKADIILGCDT